MSRYERRIYFESLCKLRDRYADLPDEDRTAVIWIDDVIAAVAELMKEPVAEALPAEEPKR